MVSSRAETVEAYLSSLPPERKAALEAIRKVIRKNLPRGFEEGMQYGMIGYYVPLSRYPDTYNGQALGVAALASQKQYMSLYLMGVYGDPKLKAWFERAFRDAGKKLDMGKSCVRFKTLDDVPLDVIGQTIAQVDVERFLATYEAARGVPRSRPANAGNAKAVRRKSAKKATARGSAAGSARKARKPAGRGRKR